MEAPEIFDYDPLSGTGFYEGARGTFSGKVGFLLGHALMHERDKEAIEDMKEIAADDLDDYVDKKFKEVKLHDSVQRTLGSGKRAMSTSRKCGGNAMPLTQGAGSIGTFLFDPSRAMVKYSSQRSRTGMPPRY